MLRWRTRAALVGVFVLLFAVSHGIHLRGGGADSYAFMGQQDSQPVTFNHCQPIVYQVNPFEAPPQWSTIVHDAFGAISQASGFSFVDGGTTTKRAVVGGGYYPGNGLEPVLIEWSDTLQSPTLSDAWGYARPFVYDMGNGHQQILTAQVVMGTDLFSYAGVSVEQEQTLVLEHEIGHVLGLAHVEDHRQLMNNGYVGQTALGAGDIAGLRRLYAVPCQ